MTDKREPLERIWYIIVDRQGEEMRTNSEREANIAFRSGAIITTVREIQMLLDDETLIVTRAYCDMKWRD